MRSNGKKVFLTKTFFYKENNYNFIYKECYVNNINFLNKQNYIQMNKTI